MNISDFIIILSYMVFLSYSPGPNNILCSINGTKYGWKKTIPLITGMVFGFFLVGFITSLSIEFIKGQEDLLDSMKYFCCMYLLYLSYMIVNDEGKC
jgi:threonine/homoserine/homoserine lactone efflux protein